MKDEVETEHQTGYAVTFRRVAKSEGFICCWLSSFILHPFLQLLGLAINARNSSESAG